MGPRLVQANVPPSQTGMEPDKHSTKRNTGGSLRTLANDTHAPSGVPLTAEDLLKSVRRPTERKGRTVDIFGCAKQVQTDRHLAREDSSSKQPLRDLVSALEKKA